MKFLPVPAGSSSPHGLDLAVERFLAGDGVDKRRKVASAPATLDGRAAAACCEAQEQEYRP